MFLKSLDTFQKQIFEICKKCHKSTLRECTQLDLIFNLCFSAVLVWNELFKATGESVAPASGNHKMFDFIEGKAEMTMWRRDID